MQSGYEVFCTGCGSDWQVCGYTLLAGETCTCFMGASRVKRWSYCKIFGSITSVMPPLNYVMIGKNGSVVLSCDLHPLHPLKF